MGSRFIIPAAVVLAVPFAVLLADPHSDQPASAPANAADWPMYNYDVIGTRHNVGERSLGKDNVARLEEKWRFPAKGSWEFVGVIHATPVVVNGCVYFGTATLPRFYKLAPNGQVKWSYPKSGQLVRTGQAGDVATTGGIMGSALVTADAVYFTDLGGYVYALDRQTGEEKWKLDTRSPAFPDAHPFNGSFASPILAGGNVIVAGGAGEQWLADRPGVRCTGRGFVVAVEPQTGRIVWKYDVGPKPLPLTPTVTITDSWGTHVFQYGPATSTVWCTPSYEAATQTLFFGTDADNAPRQPTPDDPRLSTRHSCAVVALDARTGGEKWVTQLNAEDVWHYGMVGYDPKTGRYKDQSIGDTPKLYTIDLDGKRAKVVGLGCKNGGYYVLDAATGQIVRQTPVYTGAPAHPPVALDPRTLALPGLMGGLQTGCATDGKAVFTNGVDFIRLGTGTKEDSRRPLPTGGRVVSISLDTRTEYWRHERPIVKAVGGTPAKPQFTDVGDPVASGIALANGVAYFTTTVSNQLVALDTASGTVRKEIPLGPVWCGPSVSRGRVYVGAGNLLFAPQDPREGYFPKGLTGILYSFGLPGADEVSRMGRGTE
jgi:glucose dehydrogenase